MQQHDQARIKFRGLNRLYGRLFLLLIAALVASSLLVSNTGPLLAYDPAFYAAMKTASIAVGAILLMIAYITPQRQIRRIDSSASLSEKIGVFRQATILRLLLLAGAGISTCIFFILTADTDLILLLAIIIIFLILARPTPFKTATDLKLNEEEKNTLMQWTLSATTKQKENDHH